MTSKEKRLVYCRKPLQKATQYNTWGGKVFEEWQQQQNACAILEIVDVADLK